MVRTEFDVYGTQKQAVRRAGGELDELGRIGQELQLRPMWQRAGQDGTLRDVLGTTMGKLAATAGLRSRPARAVQRTVGQTPPTGAAGRVAQAIAAGEAVKPLQTEGQ